MSEMSERVTKAIRDELINIGYGVGTINAGQLSDALSRAAILVMREPTEAMCTAGQKVNNLCEEPGHFEFLSRDEMTEAWQAMIDEALR